MSFPLAGTFVVLSALLSVTACVNDPDRVAVDTFPPHDLLLQAEEHYRKGEFAQAMAAYDAALALDSSLSKAYYGHAQAVMAFYGLNPADIFADFEAMDDDPSTFAFLDHPDSILTLRLQVTTRVRAKLAMLTERDSLTRWYRYLTDSVPSAEALADPLYAARRAFMENYFMQAELGVPGYRRPDRFPLSDLKMAASNVALDYILFDLVHAFTRLYDLDRNDTIDHRDSLMKKLRFGSGGGLALDSLQGDSTAAQNMNELILKLVNGLDGNLCALLVDGCSPPDSGNASDTGAAVSPNVDSVIASLGDVILFYQFGDKKDNDGDGCIDEEILDEKDNDLDGFVDEDARVVAADRPDLVDNDHNGRMDPYFYPANTNPALVDSGEAPVGAAISATTPHMLGFVHAFLLARPDSLFVKIRKDDASMTSRLALQRDSLSTKSTAQLSGPLMAKLDSAKALIGGCWRNY